MTATLFVSGHKNVVGMISNDLELLYHELVPKIAERVGGNYADSAEVDLWQENLHLSYLNSDDFNYAYRLVIQACKKHKSLEKYQKRLDELFKADPRFSP